MSLKCTITLLGLFEVQQFVMTHIVLLSLVQEYMICLKIILIKTYGKKHAAKEFKVGQEMSWNAPKHHFGKFCR